MENFIVLIVDGRRMLGGGEEVYLVDEFLKASPKTFDSILHKRFQAEAFKIWLYRGLPGILVVTGRQCAEICWKVHPAVASVEEE